MGVGGGSVRGGGGGGGSVRGVVGGGSVRGRARGGRVIGKGWRWESELTRGNFSGGFVWCRIT